VPGIEGGNATLIANQYVSVSARGRAEAQFHAHVHDPQKPSVDEVQELVQALAVELSDLESANQTLNHKRALAELSRNQYADLYDFAPFGYALLDNTGLIRDLNTTLTTLLKIDRKSLEGTSLRELVVSQDRERFDAHLRSLRSSVRGAPTELRLKVADEEPRVVQLHSQCRNGVSRPAEIAFCTAVIDITDVCREREEKAKLERQLLHHQKLQSLVTMAGGVAHDFNNILAVIQTNAELVKADMPSESTGQKRVAGILEACERATELSQQMLAFAGEWQPQVGLRDISETIRNMQTMLSSAIPKKAIVEYALSSDLPPLMADTTQLQQIVLNLVTNAAEALELHNTGRIRVVTMQVELTKKDVQELTWEDKLEAGSFVLLEVSDNGDGMSKETQRKMFDPFFSTKFAGRGLGLCAVLGIVRSRQGGIRVVSSPGGGTKIMVYLPPASDVGVKVPIKQEPAHEEWRGSGVLLVVDDEEAIRDVMSIILKARGFNVLTASDGEDAVHVFKNNVSSIDAVLLDMTMPRMNGEEAFVRIKALRRDVPVILMSGYTEGQTAGAFNHNGLDGFIQKPFKIEDITSVLRTVLERRRVN
jgi:nitrogen-specific signal transduction histidine kinase/CheY-like chemotaxis protein